MKTYRWNFKSSLLGIITGIAIALGLAASAQVMYNNTFPYWTVTGPLAVGGTSTLTGNVAMAGNLTVAGTQTTTGVQTFTAAPVISALTASLPVCTSAGKALSSCTQTGTGTVLVAATSPTLVTPALGAATGTSIVLTDNIRVAAPRTITGATDSPASTDTYLIANRAGTVTLTLPAASSNGGRRMCVKTIQAQTVVSASSNVVPVDTGTAGTAILAGTAGKWACMVSDATNWVVMEAN